MRSWSCASARRTGRYGYRGSTRTGCACTGWPCTSRWWPARCACWTATFPSASRCWRSSRPTSPGCSPPYGSSPGPGVEVGGPGDGREGGQGRRVVAELELFGGPVSVRVGVEVADRFDLRVAPDDGGRGGEPADAGGRAPRGGHPELADDDRLRVVGGPGEERPEQVAERLQAVPGVGVHAGPVDVLVARVVGLRVAAGEALDGRAPRPRHVGHVLGREDVPYVFPC